MSSFGKYSESHEENKEAKIVRTELCLDLGMTVKVGVTEDSFIVTFGDGEAFEMDFIDFMCMAEEAREDYHLCKEARLNAGGKP